MQIGDAVIIHKLISPLGSTRVWQKVVGVITDTRRPRGAYPDEIIREYRVYTTDGKHDWCHEDDLSKPE
jgi:hypothetical protein